MVPYYHIVSDIDVPHVRHLHGYKTVREFELDLEYVLRYHRPIDLHALLEHAREGRALPARACLITFDDGYSEISSIVAPILRAKGISATFFLTTAFLDNRELGYLNKASVLISALKTRRNSQIETQVVELLRSRGLLRQELISSILSIDYAKRAVLDEIAARMEFDFQDYLYREKPYLTISEIAALIRDGFTIGAHSIDHPRYSAISVEEQTRQTIESTRYVRDTFRLAYGAFAFPHNDTGVPGSLFRLMSTSGLIDLSFGTAGLKDDTVPNHFQRFSLEKPRKPAARMISSQYARRVARLIVRRGPRTRG
jgi:peptidoglycan/xylan/chitin deacetylase (PgdA/CDA1 family)